MIYPEIGKLAKGILDRGRHIILCTNGMFIRKRLHEFKPTSSFFFNVHLDGLERTHDLCVERDGVFREAIEGIKAAKAAGFLVCSNDNLQRNGPERNCRTCMPTWTRWASTGTCSRRPMATRLCRLRTSL